MFLPFRHLPTQKALEGSGGPLRSSFVASIFDAGWGNRQSQQRGLLDVRSSSPWTGGIGMGRDAQRSLAANVQDSFYFVLTF